MNTIGVLVKDLLAGKMEAAAPLHDLLARENDPRAGQFIVVLTELCSRVDYTYEGLKEPYVGEQALWALRNAYSSLRRARERFNGMVEKLFFFDIHTMTEVLPVLSSRLNFDGLPPEPPEPEPPVYEGEIAGSMAAGDMDEADPNDGGPLPSRGYSFLRMRDAIEGRPPLTEDTEDTQG